MYASFKWALAIGLPLALASAARAAAPAPQCQPCDGLTEFGDHWRIKVVNGRETEEGNDDRAAAISVYRVEAGQCCLERTRSDYPGVYLIGVDGLRTRVFLAGHDARWAALATNGIWFYNAASGALESVASHVWRDATCPTNPLRFAAILQTDAPPPPSPKKEGVMPPPDPYKGRFELVVFDLAGHTGVERYPIATDRGLRLFDAFFDEAAFTAKMRWSDDCGTLTWALSPTARTKTWTWPARTTAPKPATP